MRATAAAMGTTGYGRRAATAARVPAIRMAATPPSPAITRTTPRGPDAVAAAPTAIVVAVRFIDPSDITHTHVVVIAAAFHGTS
jgi:hypothetical protein